MIPHLEDHQLLLRDGLSWTEFRLDFGGRLFITGYEGDVAGEWDPTHCTSHALADIKQIHELTGAVIAALEETR
ncbi:hypothetical protein [Nocardia farcinica]|uniref:hypothetical protein n=1 Tax=Nocardia farcinica TaxID=37329 RepID=UPI0018959768|nr:hypothetical protein [Nocardia farcinica]MBF6410995.1 hypothetical protein [Nocardia farcinica]